jgi:NADH-quinone oxidoreductase subunit M
MFSAVDNFPALLIWLPLVGSLLSFFIKSEGGAKASALFFSLLSLGVVVASLVFADPSKYVALNQVSYLWLPGLGSSFSLYLDGLGKLMGLLTALVFTMVFLMMPKGRYTHANRFYGLMLMTQCGLMGVFMASDALVFYLFWELALIPVYFLSSIWGGEKRIRATFKFFIYTFAGSLFLLIGILYMYLKTSNGSFSLSAFYGLELSRMEQYWLFFLFFVAFAIKMPVFPLHTWQPEAYEQSPTPVTAVLSAVMVKMGLFGLLRWLVPFFPIAVRNFGFAVIVVIVFGMLYASLLAMKQDNIKKLIAYSSIAHIGLMAAGVFTMKLVALEGLVLQMFNHGINIAALWFVADIIERKTGVTDISKLGGIAKKAPTLTIFFVLAAFANIALPLTNAFVGEFMIFNGLYQFNPWITAVAGISIILSAVYTLNMIKHVFYGEVVAAVEGFTDIRPLEVLVFTLISVLILFAGIYPAPVFNLIHETVGMIATRYATI